MEGRGEEEKEQQKSSFSIVLYQLFRIIFYIDNILCWWGYRKLVLSKLLLKINNDV